MVLTEMVQVVHKLISNLLNLKVDSQIKTCNNKEFQDSLIKTLPQEGVIKTILSPNLVTMRIWCSMKIRWIWVVLDLLSMLITFNLSNWVIFKIDSYIQMKQFHYKVILSIWTVIIYLHKWCLWDNHNILLNIKLKCSEEKNSSITQVCKIINNNSNKWILQIWWITTNKWIIENKIYYIRILYVC